MTEGQTNDLRIVAIAAVADNGVIGHDGDMLWHIPGDLRRFKQVTTGNTLIFGRTTMEGIGLLPDRRIIVVTRDPNYTFEGAEVAHSVEEAIQLAAQTPEKICYIGGGGQIYEAAWPYLTELDITHVQLEPEGSVYFPRISPQEWVEVSREPKDGYSFLQFRPTPKREPTS